MAQIYQYKKNGKIFINQKEIVKIFKEIGKNIGLDLGKWKQMYTEYNKSTIRYFPIRHHSPASSYHLKKYLEEFKPKLVFIEGPSDSQDLIKYLIDKETIPPVSIFCYLKDDLNKLGLNGIFTPDPKIPMKFKAWYPFVSYSPEYVAIKYCVENKIPVYFIDAPYLSILQYIFSRSKSKQKISIDEKDRTVDYPDPLNSEQIYQQSLFFNSLRAYFNNQSIDDIWDILFEIPAPIYDLNEYLEVFVNFSIGIRLSTPDNFFDSEVTLFREKYMAKQIAKYQKKHPKVLPTETLVVTGGAHSVSLPKISKNQKIPSFPQLSKNSLIPFSYMRIHSLNGYGAGNIAPYYYQKLWNLSQKNQNQNNIFQKLSNESIVKLMQQARKIGYHFSVADSIAIQQNSRMLASLRLRTSPNSHDIEDALILCCVKENPENHDLEFQKLIRNYFVGTKIGKISKNYKSMGLQFDFYHKFKLFQIELKEERQIIPINLHIEFERKISEFLWQLHFMNLDGINIISGDFNLIEIQEIFSEKWEVIWSPKIDLDLIDKSIYGSTVEECVLNMLKERIILNQSNVKKNALLLLKSMKMGLTSQFSIITKIFEDSIRLDKSFFNLCDSFLILAILQKYLITFQQSFQNSVTNLIKMNYYALCTELLNSINCKEELIEQLLKNLHEITLYIITDFSLGLDILVFDGSLSTGYNYAKLYRTKGALLGARYLLGTISIHDLQTILKNLIISHVDFKSKVGEFVKGLIEMCQSKIVFEEEFIKLLIEIIQSLDWKTFLTVLPGFRSAFSNLPPHVSHNLIKKIAILLGAKDVEQITQIDVDDGLKNIITDLDSQTRDILENWLITQNT